MMSRNLLPDFSGGLIASGLNRGIPLFVGASTIIAVVALALAAPVFAQTSLDSSSAPPTDYAVPPPSDGSLVEPSIPGDTARTSAETRRPSFLMFFDASNPETANQAVTFASGTSATVTSPAEFTLIQLSQKKGRREARVGSMNIGGAKTGVMDKDQIAFDFLMVRPGVFRATPKTEIAPGEYGFIYAISGSGTGGAMTARVFDFSVH